MRGATKADEGRLIGWRGHALQDPDGNGYDPDPARQPGRDQDASGLTNLTA